MLYLEDFLELVEALPNEVRDKCTTVRELDLSVQNQVELLQKRLDKFENSNQPKDDVTAKGASSAEEGKRREFLEDVQNGYKSALVDSNEKVQVVSQLFDLVERYSRRLDQDLNKFKMELEADNPGITQVLEAKVSRQLAEEETTPAYCTSIGSSSLCNGESSVDYFASSCPYKSNITKKSERRSGVKRKLSESQSSCFKSCSMTSHDNVKTCNDDDTNYSFHDASNALFFTPPNSPSELKDLNERKSPMDNLKSKADNYSLPKTLDYLEKTTSSMLKRNQTLGAHGKTDAVERIHSSSSSSSNTKTSTRPKRQMTFDRIRARPPSGAVTTSTPNHSSSSSSSAANGVQHSRYTLDSTNYVLSPSIASSSSRKKRRLYSGVTTSNSSSSMWSDEGGNGTDDSVDHNDQNEDDDNDNEDDDDDVEETANGIDSSEQRWCICNDYSYGNMIACDNNNCPIEWFHYPCVGIPESGISKKKWYCPKCKIQRDKNKKKSSSSSSNKRTN